MLLGSWDGGMFLDKRPLCSVRLHRAVERPQHGPQPLAGAQRSEPPPEHPGMQSSYQGAKHTQDGTMGSCGCHGAKAAPLLPSSIRMCPRHPRGWGQQDRHPLGSRAAPSQT